MFDLSQVTNAVPSLLGNGGAPADTLLDAISNAGFDIADLQGLAPEQLTQLLGEHGIDLASFAPEQLTSLASSLGIDEQLSGGISSFIGHFNR